MATYISLLFLSVLVGASAHWGFRRRPMFFPRMPFRPPRFMFRPRFPIILPPLPPPLPLPRPPPRPIIHQTIVHQPLIEQPIVNEQPVVHHRPIVHQPIYNQDFSSYHQHKHHHYPPKVVVRPYRDQVGMVGGMGPKRMPGPIRSYAPYDSQLRMSAPMGLAGSPGTGMMTSNPIGISAGLSGMDPMDPMNTMVSVNAGLPGMGGMGTDMMGNNMGGGTGSLAADPFATNMLGTGGNNMGGLIDPMANNMGQPMNTLGSNQGMMGNNMGGGMNQLANNMGAMDLLADIMEPTNPAAVNGLAGAGQGFGNTGMQNMMNPGTGGGGIDFAGLGL